MEVIQLIQHHFFAISVYSVLPFCNGYSFLKHVYVEFVVVYLYSNNYSKMQTVGLTPA